MGMTSNHPSVVKFSVTMLLNMNYTWRKELKLKWWQVLIPVIRLKCVANYKDQSSMGTIEEPGKFVLN